MFNMNNIAGAVVGGNVNADAVRAVLPLPTLPLLPLPGGSAVCGLCDEGTRD